MGGFPSPPGEGGVSLTAPVQVGQADDLDLAVAVRNGGEHRVVDRVVADVRFLRQQIPCLTEEGQEFRG